jgi:transposase
MRFVTIKSPEQQAVLMLHRTRELLVRQRTMLVNALRGHLAEYGIIAPQGLPSVPKLAGREPPPSLDGQAPLHRGVLRLTYVGQKANPWVQRGAYLC